MDIIYHLEEKLREGKESVDLLIPMLNDTFQKFDNITFERFDNGGDIDRKFSVDLLAIYPDRTETWAVKIRDNGFRDFDDITIEIFNGNDTKGDFYRFNGNMVSKYIYGWRENKTLYDLHICNAKKIVGIPKNFWKGNIKKEFPGIGIVNCYQNKEYGKSWFTAIDIYEIRKKFPDIFEDIINQKFWKHTIHEKPRWKPDNIINFSNGQRGLFKEEEL